MIKSTYIVGIFISVTLATATLAKDGSYKECRSISKQVEKIDDQRRRGGSGKKMDTLRKKRHQLSDKAYRLKCQRHGIIR